MIIQNEKELEILREGGKKLAAILLSVSEKAIHGISSKELDGFAEKLILKCGGKPSFKNYKNPMGKNNYPATLCVSINEEVVHGIPDSRILKTGDIVGLDIGMLWPSEVLAKEAGVEKGFYTDTALTVIVGEIVGKKNKKFFEAKRLIDATKKSLDTGISKVKVGARVGDIGFAIQSFLEREGFGVVKELVGHGVGNAVHEDPEIPNWGKLGTGTELREGMVIAIEPMVTEGSSRVKLLDDGWTWSTRDGSRAAHFEHTLVVTKNGAEILTK